MTGAQRQRRNTKEKVAGERVFAFAATQTGPEPHPVSP